MVVRIVWGQYTDVLIARLHGYLSQVSTALTQSAGESRLLLLQVEPWLVQIESSIKCMCRFSGDVNR